MKRGYLKEWRVTGCSTNPLKLKARKPQSAGLFYNFEFLCHGIDGNNDNWGGGGLPKIPEV